MANPSPSLTGLPAIYGADVFSNTSAKQFPFGALGYARGGNKAYRYCQAGGADLAVGKLAVAATIAAYHVNQLVDAAAAINAMEVEMNIGATAITAGDYNEGELVINDATGEGVSYWITGHDAFAASGTGTVYLGEPVQVALVADTSEASLIKNNWDDIVISVSDQADMAVGVPNVTLTTLYHGWVQTRGLCAVLADETIAVGKAVCIGNSTGGAVGTNDAAGEVVIGIGQQAGVDTEYRAIYLTID